MRQHEADWKPSARFKKIFAWCVLVMLLALQAVVYISGV